MDLTTPVNDAPQTAPAPWSEEDLKWLETVPQEVKPIAQRYGRACFSLVMQHGAMNHGLQVCFGSKPPKNVQQALMVVANSYNNLFPLAMKGLGLEEKIFVSCKEDVERLAALMAAGGKAGENRSAGGIVLTS